MVGQHPGLGSPDRLHRLERRSDLRPQGRGDPRRHQEAEVERLVQLIGPDVLRERVGGPHPRLGAEDPVGVVPVHGIGVGDLAPATVDVVHAWLVPHRQLGCALHRGVVGVLRGVRQTGHLDETVRHVDPETVGAAVQPEPDHRLHLVADFWVGPVEVRLGGVEQVEVPLARAPVGLGHPGPSGPTEVAAPVVGRQFAVLPCAVAEHVACPLDASRRRGEGRLEPRVLAGGVVGHQVEQHAQPELVGPLEQRVGVCERAEARVDVAVVGHVVTRVVLRGGVERRDPHCVDAQRSEVVQPRGDPGQVTHAVTVGVRP